MFAGKSRESVLKNLDGIICADGSVSIYTQGARRIPEARVAIYQSNMAFLDAVNQFLVI